MRTNIDIDDKLIAKVMKQGGFATKKEAVNAALETLARQQAQKDALLKLRGKLAWDGDLDAMRRD
ncbi:MAG: type II toxin-antitoxin system VapB family antitoxin [Hyphomonas sp.]|uniref:type II toxin-antitoxin system VapB family antitoxin n=1 Tax=Hyphomonas sp. TaxID=87 RepID=UPI001843B43E|nr:type II toxin-antitoxin system VapB family antitoxin [Hyphomonas sp.]MBA3070217.1 type II toxin-antitoxin system VapB family antitoxin [Hyphomonas sp.]MBU3921479.1 type II toxin-antitoxin system VapB family antitoxin [Alphaproteobacteria bacterium]MBU4060992.1 type II toxin-antitoxin system VapB family antitoxin [Alphaproteobacteria bacterium]MBU4165362.1 type II toxin-antitoxin system VapB family antitoxin [Alphaproteobacteria bacterium]